LYRQPASSSIRSRSSTLFLALALLCPAQLRAQTPADPSTYTFQADTHLVLIDVTVTDAKDNPVHDLPQFAFRVFDNKQPQLIASFEEHKGIPAATILPATTPGVDSNDYLLHLPPVLNIVLIDIANMNMADQIYLSDQLTAFLNKQPDGQPLAIYLRAGLGCFLVQNFTSDRKLLLGAVHKAPPHFPPQERRYLSDFDTLYQIAFSLSRLPGRKNVLWFSGGSTRCLKPDTVTLPDDSPWRDLYDELNLDRIAVYPIDVRGLVTNFSHRMQGAGWQQHMAMKDAAQATGGEAFYNSNGLTEITDHVVSSDGSFYTLTYAPHNLDLDNNWHKIHVEVDGHSYHLSYRTGYFADGSVRRADGPAAPRTRTRLLLSGGKLEVADLRGVTERGDNPIIFQASALSLSDPTLANMVKPSASLPPVAGTKSAIPYSVRFTLPLNPLKVKAVDGKYQAVIGVAEIALNRDGGAVERNSEQATVILNEKVFHTNPNVSITLDQQLNLAKDDRYLKLVVWDTISRRFGTLQIPLETPKISKHQKATGIQNPGR